MLENRPEPQEKVPLLTLEQTLQRSGKGGHRGTMIQLIWGEIMRHPGE
jgi:hypothetical protein